MRAARVALKDLKTEADHWDTIDKIERDYHNTQGGWKAWNSGWETFLTATAEKKIMAIEARVNRLFPADEDC